MTKIATASPWPLIWIFLNGPNKATKLPETPPDNSWILAADGGANHLIDLGWPIHLLVGDLDSFPESDLPKLNQAPGFEALTFPKEKDETDFELLLPLALERFAAPSQIAVVAGLGGRWDMTMANLLLPWAAPYRGRWKGGRIVFYDGTEKIYCLQGPTELAIAPNSHFSLIPALGSAGPISLWGDPAYPLNNGRLVWGHTRGLSNETGPQGAVLTLARGTLVVTVAEKELTPVKFNP
ncbi:MAG: thiamine diphosphokinase [Deltaproteobacteria bacterium]|jgi:thiamine pyrophosphokinase|nr:thiamine diphosphokinase [Deltaproteobacteria bacterium]